MIELDRHIEILLLSNDCVIIPNFGGFMAHYVESRNDERDAAFLPPMRTIGFNPKLTLNDSLLAQSYVEVYDISYPDAISRIEDEVRELKQHLANNERYEMNSIGVLKMNQSGNYEFEPCSAGILTPSLYGLSYYEFKTLEQLEEKGVTEKLQVIPAEMSQVGLTPEKITSENNTENKSGYQAKSSKIISMWRNIAIASVAFILFLLIPAPLANNKLQLTQSKVNTSLLEYVMPKEVTTGEKQVESIIKVTQHTAASSKEHQQKNITTISNKTGFTIVLASKIGKKNAEDYVFSLYKKGYKLAEVFSKNSNTKVIYGAYTTQEEAYRTLHELHEHQEFSDAWVMKY